jgi:hypothetical protein
VAGDRSRSGARSLVGGPLVTAVGGRQTLLLSALLTIALGALVGAVLALNWLSVRQSHLAGSSVLGDELDPAIQRG